MRDTTPGEITLDELLTSSGKYVARAAEADASVRANALVLLKRVNALLTELKITHVMVSSGFRTAASNASLPNSAKKSLHMVGKAIDLVDNDSEIKGIILRNPSILTRHSLWMEDPFATPTWVHFDIGDRKDRPIRIFRP